MMGAIPGRNVTIEHCYADNQMDRLRPLASDLIARKVGVIVAFGGNIRALVARTLTSTIPVVFTSGRDPVEAGLVASLNRPEANVTGAMMLRRRAYRSSACMAKSSRSNRRSSAFGARSTS